MSTKSFRRALLGGAISCFAFIISPEILAQVTDTGSSDITLNFTESVSVMNVGNVTITDPSTGTNATSIEPFCISGVGFSTFEITFESNDTNNDTVFELTNGTNTVDYTVGFDNSLVGSFTTASEGIAMTGQTLNGVASDCSSDNARFEITIANADWENSTTQSGSGYADTLLITVTSE
ncbi:hypothetical protein ACJJIF_10685 [Microbulbifer sp. SSSA002]|uniref:hypothetical protein n=1 Tax=Microbulbifer sp. SSSA002 TaxID=3243376 RepID=UPI00403A4CC8